MIKLYWCTILFLGQSGMSCKSVILQLIILLISWINAKISYSKLLFRLDNSYTIVYSLLLMNVLFLMLRMHLLGFLRFRFLRSLHLMVPLSLLSLLLLSQMEVLALEGDILAMVRDMAMHFLLVITMGLQTILRSMLAKVWMSHLG